MKANKIIKWVFFLIIIGLVLYNIFRPDPVTWSWGEPLPDIMKTK